MSLTPRRALVLIDIQNDYITGNLPIEFPNIELSLCNIAHSIEAAQKANIPIVVVQNTAPLHSPIFAKGTNGWKLHPIVADIEGSHYVEKTLPSAFIGTDLAAWIKKHNIDTLTIAGYMTHNCVDSTIKQAFHDGLAVEFLHDASGSVSYTNRAGNVSAEEIHKAFSAVLQSRFAAVLSADEWAAILTSKIMPERDNIFNSNQRARKIL